MTRRLPSLATLLGLGGLVPFIACGFGAVWITEPVNAARLLAGLITYAAVILSFLGAVHWGLALAEETGLADRPRLVLGVLPALIGWAALLVFFLQHQPDAALAILAAGFVAVVAVEQRGVGQALMPRGYIALRWVLTVVVVAVLLAVLVIRTGLHLHG